MGKYAQNTSVPILRSQQEIRKTISRYGGYNIANIETPTEYRIAFGLHDRKIVMGMALPEEEKECRRLFRVLLLKLKARLEVIASEDSTVDEEFMPYIMLPEGSQIKDRVMPAIIKAYESGKTPKLSLEF